MSHLGHDYLQVDVSYGNHVPWDNIGWKLSYERFIKLSRGYDAKQQESIRQKKKMV